MRYLADHANEIQKTVLGTVLATNPVWLEWMAAVSEVLSFIAVACGAIMGLSGVIGLVRSFFKKK